MEYEKEMTMATTLKMYRTNNGTRVALVRDGGRKYLQVLMMDGPLTVQRVPLQEAKYMEDYRPLKAKDLKTFRLHGKAHGMTAAARSFLREAAAQ